MWWVTQRYIEIGEYYRQNSVTERLWMEGASVAAKRLQRFVQKKTGIRDRGINVWHT